MDVPAIRACLFDMDGLLLNTEDLITACVNSVLKIYSKPSLPWSVKARIQGRTAEESDAILQDWAQLPISMDEYRGRLYEVQKLVFPTAEPLPGVVQLLQDLQTRHDGKARLALATSSSKAKFALKIARWIELFGCFPLDCRVLGDDMRVVEHKPAPDIYLCALQRVKERLGREGFDATIGPQQCLVFEDSIQGVEAGRRAGMQVVWCPHPGLLNELFEGTGEDVRDNFRAVFSIDADIPTRHTDTQTLSNQIAYATNGWVTLVESLEDFNYGKYGL